MHLLRAEDIRAWDRYTIDHEPITSLNLMERAAAACTDWIMTHVDPSRPVRVFCGKGNNGGDGLVIARLMSLRGYEVSVYILEFGKIGTPDFQTNLQRLQAMGIADLHFIQGPEGFPRIEGEDVLIDALFGTGLTGRLEGLSAGLIGHLNGSGARIMSVDLPSGLLADEPNHPGDAVVQADVTLSFQAYKLALLLPENARWIGEVVVLDIGLHPGFLSLISPTLHLTDASFARSCYRPRSRFAHKGDFGHALLVAGAYGKMGAAVLAASACLRSGVGLLTCLSPACGYVVLQTSVPEAMTLTLGERELEGPYVPQREYAAVGLGPGIGTGEPTVVLVGAVLRSVKRPVVMDADALNILARHPEWMNALPPGSILTPHPKEFDRLFGPHGHTLERLETALRKAAECDVVIVLKGHHSVVVTPGGHRYFNTTGNAGMARGGSGDVLTGILTALLAQGYDPVTAAVFGVFLHGLAGDEAAGKLGMDAMTAGDLVRFLPEAFLRQQEPAPPKS